MKGNLRLIWLIALAAMFPAIAYCQAGKESNRNDTAIYQLLTIKPVFNGDLNKWLSLNLKYPDAARENQVQGKSVIRFLIDEHGIVSRVGCARSSGDRWLDTEAIRVVRAMPPWQPGYYKKRPVRVVYLLPVVFRLEG